MKSFRKIGQLIKFYREKNGVSFENLSQRTGLNTKMLEKIEDGEMLYDFRTLENIAKALNVDMKALLDFETS